MTTYRCPACNTPTMPVNPLGHCDECWADEQDTPTYTTYRGHTVTVLADGRWRFGPLTFETTADAKRWLNHLPRKATP